jgi:predicted F0F1-ATPase subunit
MNEDKNKNRELLKITRLTSVGIGLIISIMIGYCIGYWLDKHLHTTQIFTIIFIVLGMGAGFLNIFRTLNKDDT